MLKNYELLEKAREINSYNGDFEEYGTMFKDLDELIDTYYRESPSDLARAIYFGNIKSWIDAYFFINNVGNIESCSEYELDEMLERDKEDIEKEYKLTFC